MVTLLPDPDSPTTPRNSPRLSSKLTPLTAWTTPSCVTNRVSRSLTSRTVWVCVCVCVTLPFGLAGTAA
jgi:hypothetical protein